MRSIVLIYLLALCPILALQLLPELGIGVLLVAAIGFVVAPLTAPPAVAAPPRNPLPTRL